MTQPRRTFFGPVSDEKAERIYDIVMSIGDHVRHITENDSGGMVVEAALVFAARVLACSVVYPVPADLEAAVVEHFAEVLAQQIRAMENKKDAANDTHA